MLAIGVFALPSALKADASISKTSTPLISRLTQETRASATKDSERLTNLMAWIAESIGIHASGQNLQSAEDVLRTMKGECGHREWIMSTVAHNLGLQTRRIAFFNIPVQLGHTAIEVKIDKTWRFYDPSTGIYFSRIGQTAPIGIAEARRFYPDITIWQTKDKLFQKHWADINKREFQVISPTILMHPIDRIPMLDIERTYFASAMSGAPEVPIVFSGASVFLDETPSGWIGKIDGSGVDIAQGQTTINQKAYYTPMMERIGNYDGFITGRRFRFHASKPTWVTFTTFSTNEMQSLLLDIDPASPIYDAAATALSAIYDRHRLQVRFLVSPPYTVYYAWLRGERSLEIDAYAWSSELDVAKNDASFVRNP